MRSDFFTLCLILFGSVNNAYFKPSRRAWIGFDKMTFVTSRSLTFFFVMCLHGMQGQLDRLGFFYLRLVLLHPASYVNKLVVFDACGYYVWQSGRLKMCDYSLNKDCYIERYI